jgi:uncharacterized protein YbjT (DUF2867 family)
VGADLDRTETLPTAVRGCHGVYSVQNYWERGVGFDGEIRQGTALVDAARDAGVTHFVQSSVAHGTGPDAEAPEHFRCKWAVEDHLRASGLPWTAIRTVFFYDNLLRPSDGWLTFPALGGSLRPDLALHGVVVDDLGAVAARVFEHPERYARRAFDLASDQLTVGEMRAAYARATGREPPRWTLPHLLIRIANSEFAAQLRWNNQAGWPFSLEAVREHLPEPTSFEAFCRRRLG